MPKRFAIGAQRAILHAVGQAELLGMEKGLSTKHLLLGLLADSNSTAVHILLKMGLSVEQVRAEIERQAQINDERPYSIEPTEKEHRERSARWRAVLSSLGPAPTREQEEEALKACYPAIAFGNRPGRQAIEIAYNEARTLGTNDVIDTEHMLLGLIQEKYGLASRVLVTAPLAKASGLPVLNLRMYLLLEVVFQQQRYYVDD